MQYDKYDFVVVGAGFFGCYVAQKLAELNPAKKILLLEKNHAIMKRASWTNQARVHRGYHYPRSLTTGLRSQANFNRFTEEYRESIYDNFNAYYAVAKNRSNVTSSQFEKFCKLIGAPLSEAPANIRNLFNKDHISTIYKVEEPAFNTETLANLIFKKLKKYSVNLELGVNVEKISSQSSPEFPLSIKTSKGSIQTQFVLNCSYSSLNEVLESSSNSLLDLKFQLTETPLLDVPSEFKNLGITIMCGPFFSLMPFPALSLHSLHHVRYTPHAEWTTKKSQIPFQQDELESSNLTRWSSISLDIKRFIPSLSTSKRIRSMWEIKTLLPQSEREDSRPILFHRAKNEFSNVISILGGKIDNVFDLDDQLEKLK